MATGTLDETTRAALEGHLRTELQRIYGSNRWIIATEYLQGAVALAETVADYPDTSVLALGARVGVGPVAEGLSVLSMDLPFTDEMITDMRTAAEALRNPSPEFQTKVDQWDPTAEARVLGSVTATAGMLVNRSSFGARPQHWCDLEDKLAIEALWAAADIPLADSAQVALSDVDGVLDAHDRLRSEAGTVWAVDNSLGWHGGGAGTFWVADRTAAEELCQTLSAHSRVRIMPFLEGVPCSIHGMVIPVAGGASSATVAFRPAEMMMLRDRVNHRFIYGRAATYWDPAPDDRIAMRDTARRIGDQLARQVGFRGAFTVDGVMSTDGFVPTEVNTRYGAALPQAMPTLEGDTLSLYLIHLALVEDELDDLNPEQFERWVVENLDRRRTARGFFDVADAPDQERTADVDRTLDGVVKAVSVPNDVEPTLACDAMARVRWGAARGGGMFMVNFGPSVAAGPATAPLLVEVIEAAAELWSLPIPPIEAARSVR